MSDPVNKPAHYEQPFGSVYDITRHFNFTIGNVLKYVLRADLKGNRLQDLRKAAWYLQREIENEEHRLESLND